MLVQAYLDFDGRCEEALAFYRQALGAEVTMLMRWKDSPDPAMSQSAHPDKIMHASFKVGDATVLASDGRSRGERKFAGFMLSLTVANEGDAKRVFDALADGGEVQMPLGKTFFSPCFGMVADRFGVGWIVYVEA
jgi:PhnB protein